MKTVAIALLGLVAMSMCGCQRHGEDVGCAETLEISWAKGIEAEFKVKSGTKLLDSMCKFCDRISSVSNTAAKAELYNQLAQVVSNIDYENWTMREVESMTLRFGRMCEALAYDMFRNGATEQEIWNAIFPAFEKYRKVCFSFGDEKDYSDGRSREARNRRLMAETMRLSWEQETAYFEQDAVRLIFRNDPVSAEKFLERWHQKF